MGYEIYKLQNVSGWSNEQPDIVICENDPGWNKALENWKQGKHPTTSSLWKKGVVAITSLS